jgi:hypothetical protein
MTPMQYFILAFAISVVMLWGYPLLMWLESRALAKKERRQSEIDAP